MMKIYKKNKSLVQNILGNVKNEIKNYDINQTAQKIYKFLKIKLSKNPENL